MNLLEQLYANQDARILNADRFDLEPNAGDVGISLAIVKGVNETQRTVTAVVSTPNLDRYGEVIEPTAFEKWLDVFMLNPVLLAGHQMQGDGGEPTIIGQWVQLDITREGLIGTCKFLENDDLAEKWWQRYKQRAARAFSVGFVAHAWEMRDMQTPGGTTSRVRVFTEAELVEISAVAVPANREALVRNAMNLGAEGGEGDAEGGLSNRRLNKVLSRSIAPIVRDELRRQLSPDIGGHLFNLIQEAVEMAANQIVNELAQRGMVGPASRQSRVDSIYPLIFDGEYDDEADDAADAELMAMLDAGDDD